MFNNYNLCHVRTINWDEIITGHNAKYTYVYNFTSPERECPACHANCSLGCWGEVRRPLRPNKLKRLRYISLL